MKQVLAPALLLLALATILPELLSGNTPAALLFTPPMLVFLLLAYAVPVLLLRELCARLNGGLLTLFMFGLAYGIINEALLAKTVFRSTGVPVDVYDGYGFHFGIQWAWTAFILPWHAMASMIIPVIFAHVAFPKLAATPWLGAKTAAALAISMKKTPGSPDQA
jgi:hypothetical protein